MQRGGGAAGVGDSPFTWIHAHGIWVSVLVPPLVLGLLCATSVLVLFRAPARRGLDAWLGLRAVAVVLVLHVFFFYHLPRSGTSEARALPLGRALAWRITTGHAGVGATVRTTEIRPNRSHTAGRLVCLT